MVLKRACRGSFTVRQRYTVRVSDAAAREGRLLAGLLHVLRGEARLDRSGAILRGGRLAANPRTGFRRSGTGLSNQALEASAALLFVIALERHDISPARCGVCCAGAVRPPLYSPRRRTWNAGRLEMTCDRPGYRRSPARRCPRRSCAGRCGGSRAFSPLMLNAEHRSCRRDLIGLAAATGGVPRGTEQSGPAARTTGSGTV